MPHIEPEVGIEINGQVLRRSVFRDVFGVLLDHRQEQTHFEEVRGQWEERFERRFGFWRGFVDEQVRRYLDCGLFENGFARVRCPDCAEEYLLAFSCKTRELCPSCAAKRSAATAALLFRHKVMRLLQDEGLLSEERSELLLSWRHTGFSVHNLVRVEPEDQPAEEHLARYIMRPPISLDRIAWEWGAEEEAEVSNGGSRGGFVFGMRGTLDGVEKQIPIPQKVF